MFTLLEALYGAFDSIARKRGVFKVETIGKKSNTPKTKQGVPVVFVDKFPLNSVHLFHVEFFYSSQHTNKQR